METKIIYHVDDEETPYLVKVNKPPKECTLLDFKKVLKRPNCKYFFKSMDADFGIVKEEITNNNTVLPYLDGRVISWVVMSEMAAGGDASCDESLAGFDTFSNMSLLSHSLDNLVHRVDSPSRSLGKRDSTNVRLRRRLDYCDGGDSASILMSGADTDSQNDFVESDCGGDCYSVITSTTTDNTGSVSQQGGVARSRHAGTRHSHAQCGAGRHCSSRGCTDRRGRSAALRNSSRRQMSLPSLTDSTLSINKHVTVALTINSSTFLGISIVGQTNRCGDGGIYVGSIMKGGVVAEDGRIEPGDMIVQVNDTPLHGMSNDHAVAVLREAVNSATTPTSAGNPLPAASTASGCPTANSAPSSGKLMLVIVKCWSDPSMATRHVDDDEVVDDGDFEVDSDFVDVRHMTAGAQRATAERRYLADETSEPARPIDPAAWLAHTAACREYSIGTYSDYLDAPFNDDACLGRRHSSMSTLLSAETTNRTVNSGSELTGVSNGMEVLSVTSGLSTIAQSMASPDSGLDVKDRVWLKVVIPQAFLGADAVNWLWRNVNGLEQRKGAKACARELLGHGLIKCTVNRGAFSERSYYTFSRFSSNGEMNCLDEQLIVTGDRQQVRDTMGTRVPRVGHNTLPVSLSSRHPYKSLCATRSHMQDSGSSSSACAMSAQMNDSSTTDTTTGSTVNSLRPDAALNYVDVM